MMDATSTAEDLFFRMSICPTIDNNRPYDYSNIKNVYCVDGGQFTAYCKE